MTEAEWLACDDPEKLLDHLCGRRVYARKLRLFACACCRLSWEWLKDERSRKAVELSEHFADGTAKKHELVCTSGAAFAVVNDLLPGEYTTGDRGRDLEIEINVADAAWRTSSLISIHQNVRTIASRTRFTERHYGTDAGKGVAQVRLLRDIFGQPYPFPQIRMNGDWLARSQGQVVSITRSICDEGSFAHLAVLADALEEAGCTDAAILSHLRSPGPHVRGCWALDLILGRE